MDNNIEKRYEFKIMIIIVSFAIVLYNAMMMPLIVLGIQLAKDFILIGNMLVLATSIQIVSKEYKRYFSEIEDKG